MTAAGAPPIARASRAAAFFRASALLVVGALLAPGLSGATQGEPFSQLVGLTVKFSQGEPATALPLLTELRVAWVRDMIGWAEIEPSPGKFVDFQPALKQRLQFYRQHNIGLVALLWLENDRAYPATASDPAHSYDPQAYGRFAATVAGMLRAEGVKFVLEVGNEPHNSSLPKILGGSWNGHAPSPWVDHYVRMVDEAVKQVRAFDPTVEVVSDDDMWVVHYWFLRAGVPAALSGFAIHPYADVPELTAVAADTDWTRPFQVVDADQSFTSAVRRLRDAGTSALGHPPKIWITEWGWPVGPGPFKKFITEDQLAGYLPRAFILAAAAGVEAVCWFSSRDSVDGPMGLTDNDGRQRKSFQAFKTMSEQLGAYRFVRQVAGTGRPASGLQAFLFKGAKDEKLAIWSADAGLHRVTVATTAVVDALGRSRSVAGANGPADLAISAAPIYISGSWSDEAIDGLLAHAD
jgi:hypothetical protein